MHVLGGIVVGIYWNYNRKIYSFLTKEYIKIHSVVVYQLQRVKKFNFF